MKFELQINNGYFFNTYICPIQYWRHTKNLSFIRNLSLNRSPASDLATLVLGKKRKGEREICDFKGQFRKLDVVQWQTAWLEK